LINLEDIPKNEAFNNINESGSAFSYSLMNYSGESPRVWEQVKIK